MLDRVAATLATRRSLRPWTLAEIAPAAGLSPAGLVKRFGSRHGILLALSQRWIESIPRQPQGRQPPADELRCWARARFTPLGPDATAQGLVQLVDDLVHDELRQLLGLGWTQERAYLASLLAAAELPALADPAASAAVLFDALNGAMLGHATDPDPDPVARTLDHLLELWA